MPRILIVADGPPSAGDPARHLEAAGFHVEFAPDGDEGIARLIQRHQEEIAQRRKVEEALRSSMQLHRSLVVATSQIIWSASADGNVVDDIPSWRAYTGQTFDQIRGRGWLDAVHPDDREHTALAWSQALSSRMVYETEYRIRRPDGSYRLFAIRGVPLSDGQDWTEHYWEDAALSAPKACLLSPSCRIREWVGVCTDITERKNAELALGHERDLLHALMDNVPDAIYFKDVQSRFIRVNRSLAVRFGIANPAAAVGRCDFDYFSEEHGRCAELDEREVMRTGQPIVSREEKEIWPDGRITWASTTKMPLRDDGGNVIGTFGISRDITRRKEEEEALREAEERARLLLESSSEGIYGMDLQGCCTFINKAAAEMLGYRPEEVLGRNVHELMHHSHADGSPYPVEDCPIFRAFRIGQSCRVENEVLWRRDGTSFPAEYASSPLRFEGQAPSGAVVTFTDITERKSIEEERRHAKEAAEAANRAKSEFLANMSHEIRTPMNAIIGMTELLADTELVSEQREYLEMVRKSADALLALINDILDFSKIEAGRLELDHLDFSLRDVLGDTLNTLSLRAYQKGLELAFHVASEVPDDLIGDSGRLRQIIMNLVGNALKFTETGEVVVRVRNAECGMWNEENPMGAVASIAHSEIRNLQFEVIDTGIGIPAEKQGLVFAAFTQADSSTTRRYGGTGLGLTISARLVELMGGRIHVESEVDKGSTFHFTARFGLGQPATSKRRSIELDRIRGLRALVVDDNATNRRILEETLSHWGIHPVLVDGALAALSALESARQAGETFDFILLDAHMPGMDGFMFAGLIQSRPDMAPTKVVMLTSGGHLGDIARCKELGLAAYLTKPVKQVNLLSALLRIVGEDAAAQPPEPAATPIAPARPLRILLAEDNPMNQKLAVRLLEKQGHAVVVAGNGRKALEALFGTESRVGDSPTPHPSPPTPAFDLVLMDVQMPEMDGLQAAEAIRAREKGTGTHLPIIAMTAYAMKGDRERCLAAGMDDYLSKPIRPDELYAKIGGVTVPSSPPLGAAGPTELKHIIDWNEALVHVAGDAELIRDLAKIFVDECPRWMNSLREGIAANDVGRVKAAAHPLKGSLGTFAAKNAHAAALRLETMARGGNLTEGSEALSNLEEELARLLPALDHFVNGASH